MKLHSSDFSHEGVIPKKFTCDGEDVSPELSWTGVPEEAKSLALICDDPDAPMGTWDHWIVFNISPETTDFSEGMKQFPKGTRFGQNSWKRNDYGGPCPPDREHRYFFKLYALDTLLDLPDGSTKKEIMQVMEGHILKHAELMAHYNRPQNM